MIGGMGRGASNEPGSRAGMLFGRANRSARAPQQTLFTTARSVLVFPGDEVAADILIEMASFNEEGFDRAFEALVSGTNWDRFDRQRSLVLSEGTQGSLCSPQFVRVIEHLSEVVADRVPAEHILNGFTSAYGVEVDETAIAADGKAFIKGMGVGVLQEHPLTYIKEQPVFLTKQAEFIEAAVFVIASQLSEELAQHHELLLSDTVPHHERTRLAPSHYASVATNRFCAEMLAGANPEAARASAQQAVLEYVE
jgi:hypothetical protein